MKHHRAPDNQSVVLAGVIMEAKGLYFKPENYDSPEPMLVKATRENRTGKE